MKIVIDLYAGPNHNFLVTKREIQKNIDAIIRAIENKKAVIDDVYLLDTKSILEEIKGKLTDVSIKEKGYL